ncbi:MAG TPA: hypothetical protein VNN80_02895 [Polyangiaceae bacterium]|nr:hypothetical protein [Polyangiaceae bacterium]
MSIGTLALWLLVLAVQLVARPAHAYSWMIRHGYAECGGCHVDPMGGETLTGMGRVMAESLLAQHWSEPLPSDRAKLAFGITEPDAVNLGGSFRLLSVSNLTTDRTVVIPMQADVYGAAFLDRFTIGLSLGVSRASDRYEHASKARLIGDVEGEGVLLVSRNHWVGYSLSDNVMLRAGRMNLPFGIRNPEHTAWVRSETLTDRESDQLDGVAVTYRQGPFRGELMLALGNLQVWDAAFQQRGYSAYGELLLARRLALGASSLVLRAPRELNVDQGAVSHQAHGLTLRYCPWTPIVLLAEANVLKNTHAGWGYVAMGTLDVEPLRGVHLAVARELLDRGEADTGGPAAGDGTQRDGTWWTLNWFFAPHMDARLDFVQRAQRADMIQAQLHLFL